MEKRRKFDSKRFQFPTLARQVSWEITQPAPALSKWMLHCNNNCKSRKKWLNFSPSRKSDPQKSIGDRKMVPQSLMETLYEGGQATWRLRPETHSALPFASDIRDVARNGRADSLRSTHHSNRAVRNRWSDHALLDYYFFGLLRDRLWWQNFEHDDEVKRTGVALQTWKEAWSVDMNALLSRRRKSIESDGDYI